MKRALAAATAVVAVLALSSCDAVESNDNAATVGTSEVTVDQFEATVNALAGAGGDDVIEPATGTIAGDQARGLLSSLVLAEANAQFLAANGQEITDEDRSAALAGVTLPDGIPDDVLRLIGDIRARDTAKQKVPAPSADEVAQRYAESPTEIGLVCVRQVVVATEAEAAAVVDELADGATMTELANRSIDEASKATGGEVQGENGSACIVTPQATQVLGPEVVAALFDAESRRRRRAGAGAGGMARRGGAALRGGRRRRQRVGAAVRGPAAVRGLPEHHRGACRSPVRALGSRAGRRRRPLTWTTPGPS